jgi:hypothetical protein
LAPVKILDRGYVARELSTSKTNLQVPIEQCGSDLHVAGAGKRKRTKARRNRGSIRDTKRQEQAITPNHLQIVDDSSITISRLAHSNSDSQTAIGNSEIEEPPETRQAREGEEFEQEQDGVMNI